jgi:hypothetical protein
MNQMISCQLMSHAQPLIILDKVPIKIQIHSGNSVTTEDLMSREMIGLDQRTQMFQSSQLLNKVSPTEEEQNSQKINVQNQVRK